MNDVQESGSFIVRISRVYVPDSNVYSSLSCHILLPRTIDYRSHNDNYLSTPITEAII